jgi:precorrin-3B synthase
LQSGELALGIGLAFGYSNADDIEKLLGTAAALGATSVQPSAGRSLLLIGLRPTAADEVSVAARAAGFVVDSQDPRRHIVACAGSPACASARLPTRELAPAVAHIAGAWLKGSTIVHLSGCIKGCAHPAAATLTVAGPNRLVLNGYAGDPTHGAICSQHLLAGFEQLSAAVAASGGSLSDLKPSDVAQCFSGGSRGK